MSTTSEPGHLGMPIRGTKCHNRVSDPGPFDPESYALRLRHTGLAEHWLADDLIGVYFDRFNWLPSLFPKILSFTYILFLLA